MFCGGADLRGMGPERVPRPTDSGLEAREAIRNVEFVVVTSNRGLCGAFNANVLKHADALIEARLEAGTGVTITTAGRKAHEYYRRHRRKDLGGNYPQEGWVQFGQVVQIADRVSQRYEAGEIDEVLLIEPPMSHMDPRAPPILNVLRVCDIPEILGMLAPRKLWILGTDSKGANALEKIKQIYEAAGAGENFFTKI